MKIHISSTSKPTRQSKLLISVQLKNVSWNIQSATFVPMHFTVAVPILCWTTWDANIFIFWNDILTTGVLKVRLIFADDFFFWQLFKLNYMIYHEAIYKIFKIRYFVVQFFSLRINVFQLKARAFECADQSNAEKEEGEEEKKAYITKDVSESIENLKSPQVRSQGHPIYCITPHFAQDHLSNHQVFLIPKL